MATYHEFDQSKVDAAIKAASDHYGSLEHAAGLENAHVQFVTECISVTVEDGKVCLNLPIVGKHCIPIPSFIPNGTAAEACLHICTTWKIPTGVEVTISVAGKVVVKKSFGKC